MAFSVNSFKFSGCKIRSIGRGFELLKVLLVIIVCQPNFSLQEVKGPQTGLQEYNAKDLSFVDRQTNHMINMSKLKDNAKEKRSTNGYGRYPQHYRARNHWDDQTLSHKDLHPPQNNFHHNQQGHMHKQRVSNLPYTSNSMFAREPNARYQKYQKFDNSHQPLETTNKDYSFLSNNFINQDTKSGNGITPSAQESEKKFDFPDKIVKDGQVFYRHDADQINNRHTVDQNLDKEQADGAFKIFQEMSQENVASSNDDLSKGFDLLLDHVRQAQEQSPSISAAIAGAAIRGSSKGSFSHVIGSAINGGYFAASAKGYDDKGGSIHSHIQGTGKGAGGGASAIAPGRDGEAFIQVDNSDNGLSIGQSTTHNGEAFVIADVDKDSKYHYERGDNTSSFADRHKNDSIGYSFGEAKSNLYSEDTSLKNKAASLKNKYIPQHKSELNENKEIKPLRMGFIDNIMEKVHQPGSDGYFQDFPNASDHENVASLKNYTKLNQPTSLHKSNRKTSSQSQEKGVVGLVTFPFNEIGSPPGPGELLTQAPDTKLLSPMNDDENFENYFDELPYYDANVNRHNYDYYTNKDLKFKENHHNHKSLGNFTYNNQNWIYPSEENEANLPNEHNKLNTEHSSEGNLAYQPFSSVLIDSYDNRHLLPPSYKPEDPKGTQIFSQNGFPVHNYHKTDFPHLPKNGHREDELWKTYPNQSVRNDTWNTITNQQESKFLRPEMTTKVFLDTDFYSTNLITPPNQSSFNYFTDKSYATSTSKYFTARPYNYGIENQINRETKNTNINYPYYNQNTEDTDEQSLLHSEQDQQLTTVPYVTENPDYLGTANYPETTTEFSWRSDTTTTTERMQVITPGNAGDVQHLNAQGPGFPNIRVLTMDNNDKRKQFYQREGTPIGPGEKIPGAPGYKVPPGFRGRVVLGHQFPVNVESTKSVRGYKTRVNLTPQRPYGGPVFASISGPEAASKINPSFGKGIHISLSSPSTKHSNLQQRQQHTNTATKENIYDRKLNFPTPKYKQKINNIENTQQRTPTIIRNENEQCGYYVNECIKIPPFSRNFCAHRFIIIGCCC